MAFENTGSPKEYHWAIACAELAFEASPKPGAVAQDHESMITTKTNVCQADLNRNVAV